MVFIMKKDKIDVNEHGDKPPGKLLDQISDRFRVKGQLAKGDECVCATLDSGARHVQKSGSCLSLVPRLTLPYRWD